MTKGPLGMKIEDIEKYQSLDEARIAVEESLEELTELYHNATLDDEREEIQQLIDEDLDVYVWIKEEMRKRCWPVFSHEPAPIQ